MFEFSVGLCIGWIAAVLCLTDVIDAVFKSAKFKIGDTVYWRSVEEVGENNSQWIVTLKSGTVVSCDVRVCVEETNEEKTLVFIEKEKLYTIIYKLKESIGAKLNRKEEINLEASKIRI